jgi:AraC-like DNA-binding protein
MLELKLRRIGQCGEVDVNAEASIMTNTDRDKDDNEEFAFASEYFVDILGRGSVSASVSASAIRIDANAPLKGKLHSDRHLILVHLNLKYCGSRKEASDCVGSVRMGDVTFFPANHFSSLHLTPHGGMEILALSVSTGLPAQNQQTDTPDLPTRPFSCGRDLFLKSSAEVLLEYSSNEWHASPEAAQTMGIAAIQRVAFLWHQENADNEFRSAHLGNDRHVRVLRHIDSNLDSDISVDALALIAGLSRHYFVRAFKSVAGTTPHQYVLERRIERAKTLLTDSGLSITQIAIEVGFANSSYFASMFKRIVGVSPTVYRSSTNVQPTGR